MAIREIYDLNESAEVRRLRQDAQALEAELARAATALDDRHYLAGRLQRLLDDKPDLRQLARHIQEQLATEAKEEGR